MIDQKSTRHDKFAVLIAGGMPAAQAYREAGFSASNEDVLRASASRLKRRMQARVAEILGTGPVAVEDKAIATVQDSIRAFQTDVSWCRDKLHELINDKTCPHGVRLNAIKECLSRALGLPVQYLEQNVNVRYQITDQELTEDEWFAKYAKPVDALPDPTEH